MAKEKGNEELAGLALGALIGGSTSGTIGAIIGGVIGFVTVTIVKKK